MRHRVVRDAIARGISRGELPQGTDADDVLDLLAGSLFYRRWVTSRTVDEAYATMVVEIVLAGCHQQTQC